MSERAKIAALSSDKTLKAFHREASKIVAQIAVERDKLRALISDYEDILESADSAHEGFEAALDSLSELL